MSEIPQSEQEKLAKKEVYLKKIQGTIQKYNAEGSSAVDILYNVGSVADILPEMALEAYEAIDTYIKLLEEFPEFAKIETSAKDGKNFRFYPELYESVRHSKLRYVQECEKKLKGK